MNTKLVTAQNCSLFEIDVELEEAFEQLQQQREITGSISDDSRQRCVQLFAELGKKIDRIAHTCERSNGKPALRPKKHRGSSNVAGQPNSGSAT